MRIARLMLAAPMSGSGKTTLACGILGALQHRGEDPMAFKCGPDYIDPMFHRQVLGLPSDNLDSYFLEGDRLRDFFVRRMQAEGRKIALIEGVMGLYDGIGGRSLEASSYQVAAITRTPIVLVVRAKGMARSLLSLLRGFLADDDEGLIRGVILNEVSPSYYPMLKEMVEEALPIRVLGFLPADGKLSMESRHLGLITPEHLRNLEQTLSDLKEAVMAHIDLPTLLELAKETEDLPPWKDPYLPELEPIFQKTNAHGPVRIAIAKDQAFSFLYPENERILEDLGAELIPFSPLEDASLPENIGGMILSGGYPELFLPQLEANLPMRRAITQSIKKGLPSIAECGGFLYLQREVADLQGQKHSMCGLIDSSATKQSHLVRFGYIELHDLRGEKTFLGGDRIRGHEFHYYDANENGVDIRAQKPMSKRAWDCCFADETHWWGFPHLYYGSCPSFAARFMKEARAYQERENHA